MFFPPEYKNSNYLSFAFHLSTNPFSQSFFRGHTRLRLHDINQFIFFHSIKTISYHDVSVFPISLCLVRFTNTIFKNATNETPYNAIQLVSCLDTVSKDQ